MSKSEEKMELKLIHNGDKIDKNFMKWMQKWKLIKNGGEADTKWR